MKRLEDVPHAGGAFTQLRAMRGDRLAGIRRFEREVGDIGRFTLFGNVVIINTPELVHEALVVRARSIEKSPIMRGALHPLVGQGLFTSEGELWRRQRKLMAPMFHPGTLGRFAEDMTSSAARAARTWKDGATVDIARETTRITMAIAGKTLFDADTFGESDELGAALTTALDWAGEQSASLTLILQARTSVGLERLAARVPVMAPRLWSLAEKLIVPIRWPGKRTDALEAALAVLDDRVARLIAERRTRRQERRDLLGLLLDARDEDDGATMSDKQVRDEVLTLFVAGHETTATALAWTLMLLAQHPDVYAGVRAEVDAIGRVPTYGDLERLPLSLRVFKEALRLYPPVYMFGRVVVSDVEIGGYLFPKGTIVLVSPYALQRRPHLWPDPERFDPDRFLPEAEARRPKGAFIPFSAGPRTCIGNNFALMEGPLVLATLLHHADFELVDPRGAEPEASATLRAKGGIPMRIRGRSAARDATDVRPR